MKKITFFVLLFCFSFSFSQVAINENFNSGTPTGWTDTYTNSTVVACEGSSERVNIYDFNPNGNLTSPNQVGASNATDLTISFDYRILDYPTSWDADPDTPTTAGWGSAELQYSTDDGANWTTVLTINDDNHVVAFDCATMTATVPAASLPDGADVKLQIINTWADGDYYFYVDNFSATQVALSPPNCDASLTITADVGVEGDISWSAATGAPSGYNLTVGSSSGASDILATTDVGDVTTYNLGTLSYTTTYYATIESYNDNGVATGCTEQTFVTEDAPPAGTDCNNPLIVAALPYNTTDDTANYGDDYENGSSTCNSYYMSGDDVVYSFTPSSDGSFNIALTNIGATYSGIHVLDGCPDSSPNCIGFDGDSSTNDRIFDVTLTGGTTYYIVISTWASPQSTTYTLDITENTCTNATVAYSVIDDCDVSGGFNIEVDITDMGSATDLTVSDDQGNPTQPATGVTTLTFGPYVNGTDVVITVVDDNDANCTQSSSALTQAACPPVNNDCAGAIALTPGAIFTDNSIAGSNLGATGSGETPSPSCSSYDPADTSGFGGDLWYSVVVPADGNLTIEIDNNGGPSTDSGMQVYSGTCGALVAVECNDDGGNGNFSQVVIEPAEGLAGETLLIRVFEYSGDSEMNFLISAFSATLGLDSAEDQAAFTYYPNPVQNTLTLNAQNTIENVTMYNMLGQEVLRATPNAVNSELDTSSLQDGTYFVKVTIANTTKTIRVIKQ